MKNFQVKLKPAKKLIKKINLCVRINIVIKARRWHIIMFTGCVAPIIVHVRMWRSGSGGGRRMMSVRRRGGIEDRFHRIEIDRSRLGRNFHQWQRWAAPGGAERRRPIAAAARKRVSWELRPIRKRHRRISVKRLMRRLGIRQMGRSSGQGSHQGRRAIGAHAAWRRRSAAATAGHGPWTHRQAVVRIVVGGGQGGRGAARRRFDHLFVLRSSILEPYFYLKLFQNMQIWVCKIFFKTFINKILEN